MITQYHRPSTVDEALELLRDPASIALGGGTTVVVASQNTPRTAVDLQSLAIDGISVDGTFIRIGAMTRLQDLVDSSSVPPILRDLAFREAPNTIRSAATIGGTVGAADPESEFLTGLLAYGSEITVARVGASVDLPLADVLADAALLDRALITTVSIPTGGKGAADRTARTPADRPIVAVVGHLSSEGAMRIAMSGVASRPAIVNPDTIAELEPPSDFRGSSTYRRHLASVLTERVIAQLEGGESA